MKENKRYNRFETENDHYYQNNYGSKGLGSINIYGHLKCKLVHAKEFSVIVPDQMYFNWDGGIKWIQPFTFLPCRLAAFDEDILCEVVFDISFGNTVKAKFKSSDFIKNYADGSQLFKCQFLVNEDIGECAIGKAEFNDNHDISLEVFHHTTPEIVELIRESNYLRGSSWNIQGSSELENSDHVYFTPLHEIKMNNDLERVAMSSKEEIMLLKDGFDLPQALFPGWKDKFKDDILFMKVYKDNTENRTAALSYMVPAEYIAPLHILKHSPVGSAVYYEFSTPFIHRVQVAKGCNLQFNENIIPRGQNVLTHERIIIGDATTLSGLKAPFDEENTEHIFKIEFIQEQQSIHEFWFENANENLYGQRNCAVTAGT